MNTTYVAGSCKLMRKNGSTRNMSNCLNHYRKLAKAPWALHLGKKKMISSKGYDKVEETSFQGACDIIVFCVMCLKASYVAQSRLYVQGLSKYILNGD